MLVTCKFVVASYFSVNTCTCANSRAQYRKNISLQDRMCSNDSEVIGEPPLKQLCSMLMYFLRNH